MWKLLAPGVGLVDFLTPVTPRGDIGRGSKIESKEGRKTAKLDIKQLQQMTTYPKFRK
jgi:hypothetical protein